MFVDYRRKIKRVFSFSSNLNQSLRLLITLTLKLLYSLCWLSLPHRSPSSQILHHFWSPPTIVMLFSSPFPSSYSYYMIPHPILYQFHTSWSSHRSCFTSWAKAPNHNLDSVPILPLKWGTSSWSWWCSKERSLSAALQTFKEPQFWSLLCTFFSSEAIISGSKTHLLPDLPLLLPQTPSLKTSSSPIFKGENFYF